MALTPENIRIFSRSPGDTFVILDEMGDIEKGSGIRLTLWPNFLEVNVNTPCAAGWMRIPMSQILAAIQTVSSPKSE